MMSKGTITLTMIEEVVKQRQQLAEKHGFTFAEFQNLIFVVTTDGTPMILSIRNWNVDSTRIRKNGIEPAVIYSNWLHGISTRFNTWNGQDHGIFEKYTASSVIGRTAEQCIEAIIQDSGKVITEMT